MFAVEDIDRDDEQGPVMGVRVRVDVTYKIEQVRYLLHVLGHDTGPISVAPLRKVCALFDVSSGPL